MEVGDQPGTAHLGGRKANEGQTPGEPPAASVVPAGRSGWNRPLSARDVQVHRASDVLSAALICLMILFSPWALGTTQAWSTWVMNAGGYALGLLLAVKLAIRRFKGYRPPRWGDQESVVRGGPWSVVRSPWSVARGPWSVVLLAALTLAILLYCLTSAVNAVSTYQYHSYIPWLPHSLDSTRSWFAFWSYLGLACSFWAIRDWLLGKSAFEARAEHGGRGAEAPLRPGQAKGLADRSARVPRLPDRLRRVLWLLAINGALLGLEGIAQRLEGSGKLLFLIKPHVNPGADTQFGPYAYRSNGAQYFNLLWPVCLGFWWTLQGSGRRRRGIHLLLVCGAIMAACPIISTSRGGALVTVPVLALAGLFLAVPSWRRAADRPESRGGRRSATVLLLVFVMGALGLGLALGWKTLGPRIVHARQDLKYRERMYQNARPMAQDYPVFGTGPGTFESVFQLYRIRTSTYWPAQLHNDWLETRITFGAAGSGLIALAFLTVLARWFCPGGIGGEPRFVALIWLALGGCLVHARYDFPFQIHSIVFLFLLLCAVVSILSRHPLPPAT